MRHVLIGPVTSCTYQSFGDFIKRWGDAPVHSIAAALFAGKSRIHFFREIGYEHSPYTHCPAEEELWKRGRCTCDPAHSFGKSHNLVILMQIAPLKL
jgi:Glycolipid 2-alpha-mannosyltransferase